MPQSQHEFAANIGSKDGPHLGLRLHRLPVVLSAAAVAADLWDGVVEAR